MSSWNMGLLGAASAPLPTFELIQTVNVTSNTSAITFSSIPGTFRHLELRFVWIGGSSGGILQTTFNGDSASNYASHVFTTFQTSLVAGSNTNANNINLNGYNVGSSTTLPFVGLVSILDYASASKNKTLRSFWGIANSTTSNSEVGMWSGHWRNTSAITSLTVGTGGSNWTNGSRLSLYGIRG